MKATETSFLRFLQKPRQFSVPIFQRRYSWEKKQCERLWNNIVRIEEHSGISSHFLGSIVYIEPGVQNTYLLIAVAKASTLARSSRTTETELDIALNAASHKKGRLKRWNGYSSVSLAAYSSLESATL